MGKDIWLLILGLVFTLLISSSPVLPEADVSAAVEKVTIICPKDATFAERLAAQFGPQAKSNTSPPPRLESIRRWL